MLLFVLFLAPAFSQALLLEVCSSSRFARALVEAGLLHDTWGPRGMSNVGCQPCLRRSSCFCLAGPAHQRGFPLHDLARVAFVDEPCGPSYAPQLAHQIAVSLILCACPFPICAPTLTKSFKVASQALKGDPLHRAGAMLSHFLEWASHTVHLKVLPYFLRVCPPRFAARSSTFLGSLLFAVLFFFFGLAAAVSRLGCDGWLLALKVACPIQVATSPIIFTRWF